MSHSRSFQSQTLKCIETFGMFKKDNFYYCFADRGDHFWIHAPFLLETLGVEQVKVSGESRRIFITREEHENRSLNMTYQYKPKLLGD